MTPVEGSKALMEPHDRAEAPNKQDQNAGNLGDIVKHAALCELVRLFVSRNPEGFYWLDSHAYRLEAAANPQWGAQTEQLLSRHSGYSEYIRVESEFVRQGRYLCSTGLTIELGARRPRLFLSESHEATRNALRAQLEQRGYTPAMLLENTTEFDTQLDRIQREWPAGAVLALVDPLPASREQWSSVWTQPDLGWPSARRTIEALRAPDSDAAMLLYQWRPDHGRVEWPEPPQGMIYCGFLRCPDGDCAHHLALACSGAVYFLGWNAVVTLGWIPSIPSDRSRA